MSTLPTPRVRTRSLPRAFHTASATPTAPAPNSSRQPTFVIQNLSDLKPAPRQIRRRSKTLIATLAANIERLGFVGGVIVRNKQIVAGHGLYEACKLLGRETIPTFVVDHLDANETRALALAVNKLAEKSVWDLEALAAEFSELFSAAPDLINFAGFEMPEVDTVLAQFDAAFKSVALEDANQPVGPVVSKIGDLWLFDGGHKLLCGNSRESQSYETLLGDEKVQMVLGDPPYTCPIKGHVSRKHGEFVEGSDLTEDEALTFFKGFLMPMVAHLHDGAIVDLFIDWRGQHPLVAAAVSSGLIQICHCVWDKGAGAMGSLYRHQVEHILVFKWGRAPHINNIRLGRHGRNRTTVWSSPGLGQFGRGRQETLDMHPTVKPVGLVIEALLDTSTVGGVVLDPFAGSGTTLIAAHRCRRIGRAIELDPRYVDVAIRRMKDLGINARHAETGKTFDELAKIRTVDRVGATVSTAPYVA